MEHNVCGGMRDAGTAEMEEGGRRMKGLLEFQDSTNKSYVE